MPSEEHLQKVIDEIITTEESYYKSLVKIVAIVIPYFREQVRRRRYGVTDKKVKSIFSNVETLQNFHENLLEDLQSREIARVFLDFSDYLKLYTTYANNYEKCTDTLNALSKKKKDRQWRKFEAKIHKRVGTDLQSLLIMPIQRIPRYEMLLNEVNKHTSASDSSKPDIEICCKKIKEIAEFVNNEKRKLEIKNKLTEIQSEITGPFTVISPSRVFIRKEIVPLKQGVSFDSRRKHQLMLFNDIIVWTGKKGKYKGSRYVQDLKTSTLKFSPECLILTQGDEETVEITFSSAERRENWDMSILKARDEFADVAAGRLNAMSQSQKDKFLGVDTFEIGEDSDEFKSTPMESSYLCNLINTALKEETLERLDHTIENLENNDVEELSSLKAHLAQMKLVLDYGTLATIMDDSVIEMAHKQAARISQKVAVSIKKSEGFSIASGRHTSVKEARVQSLNNKFRSDASVLKEAIFDIQEMHSINELEEKSRVQEFWSEHFGSTTISDFRSIKQFYEADFSVPLNDKTCSNLLFQFAYPRNTEFVTYKEYPISLKDFEIVANELGFPFDLSKLESASRDNSISVVETARRKAFRELLYTGHPQDIDDYLSHGNQVEILKSKFENGDSVFHLVAKRGDREVLEVVFPKTLSRIEMPTLSTLNNSNLLPLHYAVFNELSDDLYDRLFELTPKQALDAHPVLHEAVRCGKISVVQRILERGNVDPNKENSANETPLSIAAAAGNANITRRLLEYGATPDEWSVKAAIDGDNPEIMGMLLSARPRDRDILKPVDEKPLFHCAASLGTTEIVDVLLQHGSTVLEKDEVSSETPFLAAVMGGNISVARHLQNRFRNVVQDTTADRKTALHLSAEYGDVEMARSLIDLGVDVNAQDSEGNTCLMLSALNGDTSVVDVLMEHPQIDINARNYSNQTALELAQSRGISQICEKLVNSCASPHSHPQPVHRPTPQAPRSRPSPPKPTFYPIPRSAPTSRIAPISEDLPDLETTSPKALLRELINEREEIAKLERSARQTNDRDLTLMWGKRLAAIDHRILFLEQESNQKKNTEFQLQIPSDTTPLSPLKRKSLPNVPSFSSPNLSDRAPRPPPRRPPIPEKPSIISPLAIFNKGTSNKAPPRPPPRQPPPRPPPRRRKEARPKSSGAILSDMTSVLTVDQFLEEQLSQSPKPMVSGIGALSPLSMRSLPEHGAYGLRKDPTPPPQIGRQHRRKTLPTLSQSPTFYSGAAVYKPKQMIQAGESLENFLDFADAEGPGILSPKNEEPKRKMTLLQRIRTKASRRTQSNLY